MKEITIGRLPDNDIVLNNASVSRHHAKIVMNDVGIFEIYDLQSTSGTYVNGRKVKGSFPIKPGDKIMLSTTVLTTDWKTIFDQMPDEKPQPAPKPEPVQPTVIIQEPKRVVPTTVLYDFSKDIGTIFAGWGERLRQIITDFKTTNIPPRRHSNIRHFSEDVLDLMIERYDFVGTQISNLLAKLESESTDIQTEYNSDMKKLDITYQYRLSNSTGEASLAAGLNEVDDRKNEMQRLYDDLRKKVLPMVNALIDEYYAKNPPLFANRLELSPASSSVWDTLSRPMGDIQKTFYLGDKMSTYTILQEPVELKKRVYVQSLYGGNVLLKYTKRHRQNCFDSVNTLIGRMLATASNGNIHVIMVDLNEMEGTCSSFKALNKGIFNVISRYDEFTNILNFEVSRTEGIIQNLLQGDITNIAEYNQNKTEKVEYKLFVLKDIPVGYGSDIGARLAKIVRSGPRAGVSFMALVDEEEVNSSAETLKIYQQFQTAFNSAPCETYEFSAASPRHENADSTSISRYETLSNNILSAIVRKVNQGLEVKTESILKFSEYMLPENGWWSGQSANRIDLPFGLTKEMKTVSLQITQESGQNTAVVIGIPGSGKSVFLHTIIASAITHYSPAELQLYLLDFSGVEFNVYAKHKLPHARVIAPEAEREFGLSILREVFEEGNRRMALCRENGVTNIVELKRVNPDIIVPRLLVIIDEFQKIFEVENDNISKDANAKIHAIIQEYRKFGINLILATQKLPAKGIVPYDLIANRVVFKSDPNDFGNLIRWPHSVPQPRLLTGICIYNNESGAEVANNLTRSYFINASNELENILNHISEFAGIHPEKMDNHVLRTFRSDELPKFSERIVSERHKDKYDIPREIGVYVGESIAISPCHVYVPLTKDSNNNILIIGGVSSIAKGIAFHSFVSAIAAHTEKACTAFLMNFMTDEDPVQGAFQSEMFASVSDYCYGMYSASNAEEVKGYLQSVKDDVIDVRKNNPSEPLTPIVISVFDFQRGRMFDGEGVRGDLQSGCARLLEYILKNGPMVGVFTILQVDNLANLNRIGYGMQNLFCHRIALQMSEQDSDKIVGNSAANKLLVLNRPSTNYRALYYNNINNSTTKFKPYRFIKNG